jgi:hypothetical protein
LVRPLIVVDNVVAPTVAVAPLLARTVYDVIAAPPSEAGADHVTVADALPAVAETEVGAPGTVAGTTVFDDAEAGPGPAPLAAVTVNVYAVPLVRPLTDVDSVPPPTVTTSPAFDRTVYDVIALPPVEAGADQLTVALALWPMALTPVGAPGTAIGVTALEGDDGGLVPAAFVAVTVNVYDVPLVSPPTRTLVADAAAAVVVPVLDVTV